MSGQDRAVGSWTAGGGNTPRERYLNQVESLSVLKVIVLHLRGSKYALSVSFRPSPLPTRPFVQPLRIYNGHGPAAADGHGLQRKQSREGA